MRAALPCLIAAVVLAGPLPAHAADSPSIVDSSFDVVALRPLAAASLLVGGVLFVPTALLSSATGRDGIDDAWQALVEPQWDAIATRPLGEF